MKAEIIRGKLIAISRDDLTIATADDPEGRTYKSEGLDIDEEWLKRWLGDWADWVIIDRVVKGVKRT